MLAILVLRLVAFPVARSSASTVAEEGPEQAIAATIETIHGGGNVVVDGDPLASVVVLPELYERRGFRPAWNSSAADELVRAIRASSDDGLDPADYHLATIERLRAAPETPDTQGRLDLLLTDAAVRLAYHLRFGKVDPEALDPDWNMDSELGGIDPVTVLQQAIDQARIRDALEELKPRYPFYTRLRGALAEYRRIAAAGGWETIPEGGPLKSGVTDARVPRPRRRLGATGDLPDAAAADPSPRCDAAVEAGAAPRVSWTSFSPSVAAKPAGSNFSLRSDGRGDRHGVGRPASKRDELRSDMLSHARPRPERGR